MSPNSTKLTYQAAQLVKRQPGRGHTPGIGAARGLSPVRVLLAWLFAWGHTPAGCGLAVLLALGATGCARRAYTDVYVENMAAEIRDLEDQLYEYDGEYRLMEQKLRALEAEHARLRGAMPSNGSLKTTPAQLDTFVPRATPSDSTRGVSPGGAQPGGTQGVSPGKPSPAPTLDLEPKDAGSKIAPPALTPAPLPEPKKVPGSDASDPLDLKDLSPPSIDRGEPMPPLLPPPKRDPQTPVTMHSDNDLELELGRVVVPAQLASDKSSRLPTAQALEQSRIHPPSEMPSDTRIVEMKFHPTLCKAINNDQQGDDDSLYLVLQPLNESGQFVPLPADLMIIALDLSREENQATIGRWTLSTNDVKNKLQPIGSSQGIHVSLPFSGTKPQCDRLLVFAYYTLDDGRRIVAEQEVMLNNFHRQSSVWVPRAKAAAAVRTASGERPVVK